MPLVFTEPSDNVEMPEAIVEIDSVDSRRARLCSEDLRGGSVGVGRGAVALRGGGLGGRAGDSFGVSGFTAMGWLPRCRAEVGALLKMGGLLTVCWRW